jgi:hypothetical protein
MGHRQIWPALGRHGQKLDQNGEPYWELANVTPVYHGFKAGNPRKLRMAPDEHQSAKHYW